jgi:hypothetical protein
VVSHVKRGETVVCMLDHAVNSVLWVDSAPSSVSRKFLQNDVTLSTKKPGESIVSSTGNTVHFAVKGDCLRKSTSENRKEWLKRRVKSIDLTTPDALSSCPSSVQS